MLWAYRYLGISNAQVKFAEDCTAVQNSRQVLDVHSYMHALAAFPYFRCARLIPAATRSSLNISRLCWNLGRAVLVAAAKVSWGLAATTVPDRLSARRPLSAIDCIVLQESWRLPQRSPGAIRSALARSTQNWVGRRCKKRAGRSYSSHFQPDTSPAWRTLMAKAALPACPHRLRCMLVICQPMGGQKPSLNRSIQVTTRRQHGRTCWSLKGSPLVAEKQSICLNHNPGESGQNSGGFGWDQWCPPEEDVRGVGTKVSCPPTRLEDISPRLTIFRGF